MNKQISLSNEHKKDLIITLDEIEYKYKLLSKCSSLKQLREMLEK